MAQVQGSIEIINEALGTSDGMEVWPGSIDDIPAGLAALRGLTDITPTDVPLRDRDIYRYVQRDGEDGQPVVELVKTTVQEPIADAMWTATTPAGYAVTVLYRETRDINIQDIAGAMAAVAAEDAAGQGG